MENKNLFLIVGIFLAGLLLGGIFSGTFTGRSVNTIESNQASIFISPGYGINGDVLSITIDSRKGGASPIAYIRDADGGRRDRIEWCRGEDDFGSNVVRTGKDEDSNCFSRVTFQYKLIGYQTGTYYVEVADRTSNDAARAYFEVR